jgi:hypothetical protein
MNAIKYSLTTLILTSPMLPLVMVDAEAQRMTTTVETCALIYSNNIVSIELGTGEVTSFDARGFILRLEDRYLPRTAWDAVGEQDLSKLMRTPLLYSALTAFKAGVANPATAYGSHEFEENLRALWSKGTSLPQQISSRLEILETLKKYNSGRAEYGSGLVSSGASSSAYSESAQRALAAAQRVDDLDADYNLARDLRERDLMRTMKRLKPAAEQEAKSSLDQAMRAGYAAKSGAAQKNAGEATMFASIRKLNELGLKLKTEPPFLSVPSLNLAEEVDHELSLWSSVVTSSNAVPQKPPPTKDAQAEFVVGQATQGVPSAQFTLAIWYLYGTHGFEKDEAKAKQLLESAAAQGHEFAKAKLQELGGGK